MSPLYLIAALLAGAVAYLFERARRADAEAAAKAAQIEARQLTAHLSEAASEILHRNSALAFLRQEAERLNEELQECNVPGAARDRLTSMLARAASPRVQ